MKPGSTWSKHAALISISECYINSRTKGVDELEMKIADVAMQLWAQANRAPKTTRRSRPRLKDHMRAWSPSPECARFLRRLGLQHHAHVSSSSVNIRTVTLTLTLIGVNPSNVRLDVVTTQARRAQNGYATSCLAHARVLPARKEVDLIWMRIAAKCQSFLDLRTLQLIRV